MRVNILLAALALGGCGLVYTSPDVYESGDVRSGADSATSDVQVIPLTFETAAEANLDAYVPARLPDVFRPAPQSAPGSVGVGSTAMPRLPDATYDPAGAVDATAETLPPTATALQPPAEAQQVNLPEAQEPAPYRIGVADTLLVSANTQGATLEDVPSLLNAQTSRQGYIVQDDGAIAIPDVGRIRVAGSTLEEAEDAIFQALVSNGIDPSFSLEISEFNSQRVSVGGAVANPNVAPITLKPLYLSEALQLAGGVQAQDLDYTVVRLFRDGQVYQAPLRAIYGDDALRDVLLKDGDALFVDTDYDLTQARAYFTEQLQLRDFELREREFAFRQRQAEIDDVRFGITIAQFELQKAQLRQQLAQMRIQASQFEIARNAEARSISAEQRSTFKDRLELGAVQRDYVYVAGEVRSPRRTALPFETRRTLADMLFENGGVNMQYGDYGEIYVLRRHSTPATSLAGGISAYHLNASNVANLTTAAMFEMRPNDVIFVAEQPVTTWSRVVNQLTPSLLSQAASVGNVAN
ncbi:polysaccharide export outer membrane protein [Albimonas donghaensis]|uniref:Polysaccharide export outer membrane protein n=1 Tax=Albimonas donghaensis TaxID=356660 RepID=A0A1H2WNC5_9RHOB|nr:polysaccharide biosynthesis/export family protein [Albimonas donghaensis]SDW81986.1 polysaccharide export outer membrane protein [Albimonas donghaensis]